MMPDSIIHAHFDCFSGISGDMVLGAFVDMGLPLAWLEGQISGLEIGEVEIEARDVKRNGIGAKSIRVVEKTASPARTYRDIVTLIERGGLGDRVTSIALAIFERIATAEARIHRCAPEEVHFHEVGAVDSIVDIVGAALCVDYFKVQSISSSALPLGSGFVECAHGRLPLPAPATVDILKGIPVYGVADDGELVTPTGAAIVAALAKEFGPIPDMKISRTGYGSGKRESPDRPNLLRILTGVRNVPQTPAAATDICLVETNIDDMNPELFGYLMERLFAAGAVDVCFIPAMMKKSRPGTKIEVLCPPEQRSEISRCLFAETTTIGLRYHLLHRHTLRRVLSTVKTPFGEVQVKWFTEPTGRTRCTPEYEACRKAALASKVPLREVYAAVDQAAQNEGPPGELLAGGDAST